MIGMASIRLEICRHCGLDQSTDRQYCIRLVPLSRVHFDCTCYHGCLYYCTMYVARGAQEYIELCSSPSSRDFKTCYRSFTLVYNKTKKEAYAYTRTSRSGPDIRQVGRMMANLPRSIWPSHYFIKFSTGAPHILHRPSD
jgi:hypothetical protein